MNRYLMGTTDQDIMNYMFGTKESKSKDQYLKLSSNLKAHYMVGFLSSALRGAHQDLKILRGET